MLIASAISTYNTPSQITLDLQQQLPPSLRKSPDLLLPVSYTHLTLPTIYSV